MAILSTEQFVRKIKTLKKLKTKRNFYLNDMISYFNSNTRCLLPVYRITDNTDCRYERTETSEGCAIGRRLPLKTSIKLDKGTNQAISNNLNLVPDWMKELGGDFLQELQRLHDNSRNWNEKGLSTIGEECLSDIKNKFDLN